MNAEEAARERIAERDSRFAAILRANPLLWPCRAAEPEFREGRLTLHFWNRSALQRAQSQRAALEAAAAGVLGSAVQVELELLK